MRLKHHGDQEVFYHFDLQEMGLKSGFPSDDLTPKTCWSCANPLIPEERSPHHVRLGCLTGEGGRGGGTEVGRPPEEKEDQKWLGTPQKVSPPLRHASRCLKRPGCRWRRPSNPGLFDDQRLIRDPHSCEQSEERRRAGGVLGGGGESGRTSPGDRIEPHSSRGAQRSGPGPRALRNPRRIL